MPQNIHDRGNLDVAETHWHRQVVKAAERSNGDVLQAFKKLRMWVRQDAMLKDAIVTMFLAYTEEKMHAAQCRDRQAGATPPPSMRN